MPENEYEARFSYINDDNLRKHMWDTLEFISNILSIADEFTEQEKNYFHKTAILYTASIIESQIHFCIKRMWYTEIENKKTREYKNVNIIYKDSNNKTEIMSCNRTRPITKLNWCVDFWLLNKFSKEKWLYNETIFTEIEKTRKLRNKIHLMKLEDIDRKYTKKQLDGVFETARKLFKIIEHKLETI